MLGTKCSCTYDCVDPLPSPAIMVKGWLHKNKYYLKVGIISGDSFLENLVVTFFNQNSRTTSVNNSYNRYICT